MRKFEVSEKLSHKLSEMGYSVWLKGFTGTEIVLRRRKGAGYEDISPEEEAEVREQLFAEMGFDREEFDQGWDEIGLYEGQVSSGTCIMRSEFP